MSIELGRFAGLNIPLPQGQRALLVDTRKYFIRTADEKRGARGEGLLLHHQDLFDAAGQARLLHLADGDLKRLLGADMNPLENLMPRDYRDPAAPNEPGTLIAAFEPVILTARPPDSPLRVSGWFVIIQQRERARPGL